MIFSVAVAFFVLSIAISMGNPTGIGHGAGYGHGGSYGQGRGYGQGGGYGEGGHYGDHNAAGHHKLHGHQRNNKGHNNYGDAYENDHRYNNYYKGQHDKRKDFSNKNRALSNVNRNRQVGDSYRNHGKVDDGFHNVYHKEEYSKNNRFFDTDRDNKLHQNFNDYDNFYGDLDHRFYDDAALAGGVAHNLGHRGNRYGQRYYDNAEEDYANKNFAKDHEDYGGRYANQHGQGYGQGYGHGYGHGRGPY